MEFEEEEEGGRLYISLDQLLEQPRTLLFRGFLYLKTFLE
jgi:hypothetical protein